MTERPMRLTHEDLHTPRVDGYLEEQLVMRNVVDELPEQPILLRVIYSNWFVLSLAGGLGGLLAWALTEPFVSDSEIVDGESFLVGLLIFPTVAAFIGLSVGMAEGLVCRQLGRAVLCGLVGLGVGFVGALALTIPGGMVFSVMTMIAVQVGPPPHDYGMPRGFGLLIFIMGRGVAWALLAIAAGVGQGVALREKKVIANGLLGAVLGGLLGGMLFDPIDLMLTDRSNPAVVEEAAASRAVGFIVIGIMVGLFIGLVEQWTKSAWLMMKAGPLAGKQFVLYRNPTVVGSAPKADIYIFKDEAIEPRHALIHNRGGRFELEDLNSPDGTYVNGIPITRKFLENGDQIVMGKTVLEFSLRDTA